MSDLKPPRLEGDERATLHALLQYQRESLVRKVADLDEDAARWTCVGSNTTLLWLIAHLARAELLWTVRRFAGEDVELPPGEVLPGTTVVSTIDAYRRTWTQVDEVIAAAPTLDESCRDVGNEAPVNLRWVLMHLLEETARHAGHADILREVIDGNTGR